MNRNESNSDRILRGVAAASLAVVAVWAGFSSVLGVILLVVAAVLAVTAVVGFCPMYRLLHTSTCPTRPSRESTIAS